VVETPTDQEDHPCEYEADGKPRPWFVAIQQYLKQKAVRNDIMLSINNVRPANHATITDLSRLTPRGIRQTPQDRGSLGPKGIAMATSEIGVRDRIRWLTASVVTSRGFVYRRSNNRPVTMLQRGAIVER